MAIDKSWFVETGTKIQQLRKRKYPNDTQTTFAARIGVGVTTIQNLEAGKEGVAWGTVFRVLEMLDKSSQMEELFAPNQYTSTLVSRTTAW